KERERQRRVMRKLEDEPGAGHRLHPGADERHRLPDEIAAKLRVLERGNLHDRATARLDGSRSGDGVQFTCVRQSSDGGQGLHQLGELRRGLGLRVVNDDRHSPLAGGANRDGWFPRSTTMVSASPRKEVAKLLIAAKGMSRYAESRRTPGSRRSGTCGLRIR